MELDLNWRAVLARAADIQEANGHCQGFFVDHRQAEGGVDIRNCRVCPIGAIALACDILPGNLWTQHPNGVAAETAAEKFADYLIRHGLSDGRTLHDRLMSTIADQWADVAGRTLEEIVAALRAAAEEDVS
ncbi:hypothetical protein ACIBKY_51320 [Nonomuraea sp. NPDC050394]|uniref:DUF6197 family protein n=1 Tax=Nonomuraea sp. NPDC050394 TaxID=3364363 RepID=UPI003789A067